MTDLKVVDSKGDAAENWFRWPSRTAKDVVLAPLTTALRMTCVWTS